MSGCRKRRPSPDIGGLIKAKMALLSPLSATGSLPMGPRGPPNTFDPIPSELAVHLTRDPAELPEFEPWRGWPIREVHTLRRMRVKLNYGMRRGII